MNDMTLEQMQQRLSELKLEKARRASMSSNGTQSPTVMGWASAAAGDPTMLMNTKQLRDQQAFQAAESALQRKFQDEQNELNRQNTLKLAEESNRSAREAREDEWDKGYKVAKRNLDIVNAQLVKDPYSTELQKQKVGYEEDFNYYAKKLGRDTLQREHEDKPAASESVAGTSQTEGFKNNDAKTIIDTKLKGKWTDKNKKEVIDLISKIKDRAIVMDYMTKVNEKGDTVEDIARNKASAIKDLNSGKIKYDKEKHGKLGIKEELIKKDGSWVKSYK